MKRLTLPAFVITLGLAIPVAADSPAELKAKCGAAREARLAPERNQLIEQCVSKEKKDRAVCEKFYRDHGDGGTRGGVRIPRKYDDLPECVAARKPKKAEGETVDGSSGTEDATRKSKKEVKHRDSDDGVNRTRGTEDPTQKSEK
jgi:hypothetical protein